MLVVTDGGSTERFEADFVRAISRTGNADVIESKLWHDRRLSDYDAVVVYRRFRDLEASAPIEWRGYSGQRVMLDHDSFHDFTSWGRDPGRWRAVFARQRFDLLVCSGVRSQEHFEAHGVRTALLHKGYEPTRFWNSNDSQRSGLVSYGTLYRSRRAMLRRLHQSRLQVQLVQAGYSDLNSLLNRYLGMVTTVQGATVRLGSFGRAVERFRPGTLLKLEPAPEPMAKHFEAGAAGCAVFTDATPDLELLGFEDGVNVLTYETFDDLVDRIREYEGRPDELREIGNRAAAICAERHTWRNRAESLLQVAAGSGER